MRTAAKGKVISWNGTEAWWEPADLKLAATIREQMDDGEITAEVAKNQLDVIHELRRHGAENVT